MLKMILTVRVQIKQNPLTEVDPNQPTSSTGACIPQDLPADSNAILRLPQSVPKALTIEKGKSKGKQNITEAMPIVVVGNATQLWDQMPSPPKARPPYATWVLVKPQRQIQNDMEHGTKDKENEHRISTSFI